MVGDGSTQGHATRPQPILFVITRTDLTKRPELMQAQGEGE